MEFENFVDGGIDMTDSEKLQKLAHLWEDAEGYIGAIANGYQGSDWDNADQEAGALESFEDTRKDICELLGASYEPLEPIQRRIADLAKELENEERISG
jgi:hypothetical protein